MPERIVYVIGIDGDSQYPLKIGETFGDPFGRLVDIQVGNQRSSAYWNRGTAKQVTQPSTPSSLTTESGASGSRKTNRSTA